MPTLYDRPFVCPRLVGREAQVATIGRLLDEAAARRGRVLLVAGEAGVGKSRLVAEARAGAAARGFLALQGACFEPDRAFPYAPFLDLLRALPVASPADLARFLGPPAHELARLLPELLPYLPTAPAADLDPAQVRRRLFDALVQVAARSAVDQPLLLVVEDLHWADPTSLELLAFLAARLGEMPVLLLLTHRTDEAAPTLDHLLAELDRGRLTTDLTLGRLDRAGVGAMLRAILEPEVPRAPLVDAIAALTDGNPFFVEESLKALADDPARAGAAPAESQRIPRTVSDAVTRRIEPLGGAARQLLDLAAVAGRRFDFALLPAVTGLDEATSVAAVRELVRAQLVVEEATDRLAFRHALTRQAVYGRLLGRERREMHRRIAEAIEGLHRGDDAGPDLAYHYHAAGAWGPALAHGRAAGEAAQRLHAHGAAIEHFSRALEAARQLGAAPPPDLLRARARSLDNVGDFASAEADYQAALAAALAAGDRVGQMATLLELGQLWAGRDYARTGEHFERALALARASGDPAAVARSLNRVGNWHLNLDRPDEAVHRHGEALSIFERLDDRRGVAETLDLLGTATRLGADLPLARDYLGRAAALWRALDERAGLIGSLIGLAVCGPSYQTATMAATLPGEAALRAGEEALQLARAVGWRAGEAQALTFLAGAVAATGQYGRALELGRAALALAEEIEHRQWRTAAHCLLGALRLDLLDPVGAIAQLEPGLALARESGSRHWVNCASGHLASALIAARDRASAAAVLAQVAPAGERPRTMGQRLTACAAAELSLADGEPGRTLATLQTLDADVAPRVALLRAAALVALDRPVEAGAALAASLDAAEAVGNRAAEWRLRAALGQIERRLGRPSEAERAFEDARTTLAGLAETLPEGRERFLAGAASLLPPRRPPSPRRAEAARFGGLTAREREVAALVAGGRSNRDIAGVLVLGERTVETHVAHVRAKLGFVARTQIAAWAVEQGLTAPP